MVCEIIGLQRLPSSVVAPLPADHTLFTAVDPFVIRHSFERSPAGHAT
jgi:hypothetical protein